MDARTARIAAGGGLAASLREVPAKENEARNGYHATGFEPDELDSVAPHAAESRAASNPAVPGPSVRTSPVLKSNPT